MESRIEPLDEGDGAVGVGAGELDVVFPASAAALPVEDGSDAERDGLGAEFGVGGEVVSDPRSEGDDPLAYRDMRNDPVHQVGGAVDHAALGTRGADASAFAAEGHEHLEAALGTSNASEALSEDSAVEVGAEFPGDVRGQAVSVLVRLPDGPGEIVQISGDAAIEQGLFGLASLVSCGERCAGGTDGALVDRGPDDGRATASGGARWGGGQASALRAFWAKPRATVQALLERSRVGVTRMSSSTIPRRSLGRVAGGRRSESRSAPP